jgi:hypothetical protein
MTPCGFVNKYQHFGGTCSFHLQDRNLNRAKKCDTCVRKRGTAGAMSESVGTSGPDKGRFVRIDVKEERGRSYENGIWVTEEEK